MKMMTQQQQQQQQQMLQMQMMMTKYINACHDWKTIIKAISVTFVVCLPLLGKSQNVLLLC